MSNSLYPIFVKLETLSLLIIGGGRVALEKLDSVLTNAPQTSVKLVAKEIIPEVRLCKKNIKILFWSKGLIHMPILILQTLLLQQLMILLWRNKFVMTHT